MNKYLILASVLAATLSPAAAHATQSAQKLSVCLTDSLNGKERKNLSKWIYLGMSSHSVIKPYANVTQQDVDESNKYVGALVTRLLTEDCPEMAKAAFEEGGSTAFEYAFGVVGQIAMQELMAEPNVAKSLGDFEKHIHREKINQTLNQ